MARTVVAQRRGLGAWVVYVVFLAVLFSVPGPTRSLYAVTTAVLAVVTCWLVLATAPADRDTSSMLAAAVGGPVRLHVAHVVSAGLVAAPLAVLAVVGGFAVSAGAHDPRDLAAGVAAHATGLLVGAAIGAICVRAVTGDSSLSLAAAVGLLVLVLGVPATSPLGPVIHALGHDDGRAASALLLSGCLVGAAALAAALTLLGGLVARRRRTYGIAAPDA